MPIPYVPNVNDAQQDAYSPVTFADPTDYPAPDVNGVRVDSKYFFKPIQDETQALIDGRVSSKEYYKLWNCDSDLNVGDPVKITADGTASEHVSLANALTEENAAVIGFVRFKPSSTLCLLDHFFQIGGFLGTEGTVPLAGAVVYLNDFGGYSDNPGTYAKKVGVFVSDDAAWLFANPLSALNSPAEIGDGSITNSKIADGAITDSNVNAAAAIAGTKISPDFGFQTIKTTGLLDVPAYKACVSVSSVSLADSIAGNPTFDTILYDSDNMADLMGLPSQLTVKTAGLYLLTVAAAWDSSATGVRILQITVNGSPNNILSSTVPGTGGGYTQYQSLSTQFQFAVNDVISVSMLQTSGGALTLNSLILAVSRLSK